MDKPAYHFDRWGVYLGRIDEEGHYYDSRGARCGSVDEQRGVLVGDDGTLRGRVDMQGQVWDAHGDYAGFLLPAVRPRAAMRGAG